MIFRVLGSILLGGGMLGAAAGWMTIKYLDARRKQIAQRAKRVVNRPSVPPPRPPESLPSEPPTMEWLMEERRRRSFNMQQEILMDQIRRQREEQGESGSPEDPPSQPQP